MRRTQLDLDSFESGRKGPWTQEFSSSLEAGKRKEMDSSIGGKQLTL